MPSLGGGRRASETAPRARCAGERRFARGFTPARAWPGITSQRLPGAGMGQVCVVATAIVHAGVAAKFPTDRRGLRRSRPGQRTPSRARAEWRCAAVPAETGSGPTSPTRPAARAQNHGLGPPPATGPMANPHRVTRRSPDPGHQQPPALSLDLQRAWRQQVVAGALQDADARVDPGQERPTRPTSCPSRRCR